MDDPNPAGSDRWYAVRCVFRLADPPAYEERITLWQAATFEEAIDLGEAEARQYAADVGMEHTGLAQAFLLAEAPGSGSEVFSLIRASSLEPEEYLSRFFDTGQERQGTVADPGDRR